MDLAIKDDRILKLEKDSEAKEKDLTTKDDRILKLEKDSETKEIRMTLGTEGYTYPTLPQGVGSIKPQNTS